MTTNLCSIQNIFTTYSMTTPASKNELLLVPELSLKTPTGKTILLDRMLKDSLRQDWDNWKASTTSEK